MHEGQVDPPTPGFLRPRLHRAGYAIHQHLVRERPRVMANRKMHGCASPPVHATIPMCKSNPCQFDLPAAFKRTGTSWSVNVKSGALLCKCKFDFPVV